MVIILHIKLDSIEPKNIYDPVRGEYVVALCTKHYSKPNVFVTFSKRDQSSRLIVDEVVHKLKKDTELRKTIARWNRYAVDSKRNSTV